MSSDISSQDMDKYENKCIYSEIENDCLFTQNT